MKKFVAFILAILYLNASVGATVHLHFCMDKFIGWNLLNGDRHRCHKCGMEKDGDCCKDETKLVKNNIDQKLAESAIQFIQLAAVATPTTFIYTSEYYFSSIMQEYPKVNAPLRNNGVGIYILNNVFPSFRFHLLI